MALSEQHEIFSQYFSSKLLEKATHDGIVITAEQAKSISDQFVEALIKFKENISRVPNTYQMIQGETTWSETRKTYVDDFYKELNGIFEPVGGINPAEASAFWSGQSVVRAKEHGIDFASTIPGFVMNQVITTLQDTFMSQAFKAGGGD